MVKINPRMQSGFKKVKLKKQKPARIKRIVSALKAYNFFRIILNTFEEHSL